VEQEERSRSLRAASDPSKHPTCPAATESDDDDDDDDADAKTRIAEIE
jgi:hypothetical protein